MEEIAEPTYLAAKVARCRDQPVPDNHRGRESRSDALRRFEEQICHMFDDLLSESRPSRQEGGVSKFVVVDDSTKHDAAKANTTADFGQRIAQRT